MRLGRRLTALTLALIVCLGGAHRSAAQDPGEVQQFERLHAQYNDHFQRGEWQRAYDAAHQLLSYVEQSNLPVPYLAAAYDCIGASGRKAGKFPEALAAYQQLVAAARQWKPATSEIRAFVPTAITTGLIGVANTYLVLGPIEKAIDHYEQAIEELKRNNRELEADAVRSGLGTALARAGQTDRALKEFERALAVLRPAVERRQTSPVVQLQEAYADALLGISNLHSDRGRFDLAEPYARQAVNTLITYKGERHPFVARAMTRLAVLYTHQNRLAEANALFTAAIDSFAAAAALDSPYALNALENYSALLHDADQAANAEKIAQHVVDKYRQLQPDDEQRIAHAQFTLAKAINLQGRHAEAESLLQQALAVYEKGAPGDPTTVSMLLSLSSFQHSQGKYQEALAAVDRAWAIDKRHPVSPGALAKIHGARALQLWMLDRRDDAHAALAQSLANLEIMRAFTAGAERERATVFSDFKVYYEVRAGWQAASNDLPGMFQTMETMKARSLLDELRLGGIDLSAQRDSADQAQVEARGRQLREELTSAQQELESLSASTPVNQAQQAEAAARVHDARAALYEHLADIRAQSPAYRDSIAGSTQTTSLAEAQQELAPDQLMISYLISGEDSYAVIVRANRASFVELTVDDAQARALGVDPGRLDERKLAAVLLGRQGVLAQLAEPRKSDDLDGKLRALWQILLPAGEARQFASQAAGLLTIIPDGLLALLPFEALIVSDTGDAQYLLDVGPPINYAPSATVWRFLLQRTAATPLAAEPILTLGDPQYSIEQPADDLLAARYGARSGDGQFRSALTRLPYSGNEARWVQENFQKQGQASLLLTQTKATEARLRNAVTGRRILHFACHGMADASFGNLFGCLALAPGKASDPDDDGFLYAAEISELELGACELAVLSACQTNIGPEQSGEGVWNLSRAFLAAGARRVVASDWLVDDEAGATLVSYFSSYLARSKFPVEPHATAQALWKAKQQLRRDPKWSHPFYWSSLVLIGPG